MRRIKWCDIIRIIAVPLYIFLLTQSVLYAEETSNVIKGIEVEGLARIDSEEFFNLTGLHAGDTLEENALKDGIRRAFRKGIFFDIKVLAERYENGVSLKYIVTEIPVIGKITVEGSTRFSLRQIKKVISFTEGEDYRPEYVKKAEADTLQFYKRKGYQGTRAHIYVNQHNKRPEIDIKVIVDEGRPLIIKHVEVPSEIRYLVTLGPGDVFDRDELDNVINKMRKHYKNKKYIKPIIGPETFTDGRLVIPVQKGPLLKIEFKNNTAIRSRVLEGEVSYIENEEVSDELTSEIAGRIKNLYLAKGYYYAEVAAGVEAKEDVIKVSFIIFEGEQVILRKVSFKGVTIDTDAVRKVIDLPGNKPFNNKLIDSGVESMVRFYNALGYHDMEVSAVKKEFKNDGKEVDVEFNIKEGNQTKIKGIQISGNNRFDELQIRRVLKIKSDAPYNIIDIGDARYRILSLYSQYGFMDANVEIESSVRDGEAFIIFKITENSPTIIGKIILRGNNKTRTKIIRREFTLEEGDYFNNEELTKIKQRLYKLGLFNEVNIEMLKPVHKENKRVIRDMLVTVKEGDAGSIEVSLGYGDYEEFRGALGISYRNIGGYNRKIGFRSEYSSVEQKFILNFEEPWLFNEPNVPLKVYLVKEESRSVDITTRDVFYRIDKLSFIAGIEKELMKGLKAGVNYEYSFTDTKDVQPDVVLSREDTGTLGIGSISPSLFYDTRDNPFDPTSGSIHGIILKFASIAFLSETEFMKGSFHSAWFFQIYRKIVFAFSLRGGVAYSFEENEELPLIERFFLGGRTTMRGYDHDKLGPKGSKDSPTGGNTFALTNAELRIPLGKGFGLVTFVDAGNVWRTFDDINGNLKYVVGTGLRYKTPVGPVRIDYGHKLNRDTGESVGEVHFSFGQAF